MFVRVLVTQCNRTILGKLIHSCLNSQRFYGVLCSLEASQKLAGRAPLIGALPIRQTGTEWFCHSYFQRSERQGCVPGESGRGRQEDRLPLERHACQGCVPG
jgi:hypothetical protein